ncbi:MAG TPA: (d)CMP kinase [Spirochaetales bacterium]|nr:(d)CMP kinase [Spirochaetales bacterium]HPS14886.1 (d)CMP kinase [Spirochaetales bacterium]
MIVAIDGPAGCGKSSLAAMISRNLGFLYINSGNLYRAISFAVITKGVSVGDTQGILRVASQVHIEYLPDGTISVDGKVVDRELRTPAVDAIVAQVSAIPEVRAIVNKIIQKVAAGRDCVAEGRDMTTVVFPNADLKIYLDASVEKRAERRFMQNSEGMSLDDIRKNIEMRDRIDTTKSTGALKIAEDAYYLDTSGLTIEQVYEKVYSKILYVRDTHGQ